MPETKSTEQKSPVGIEAPSVDSNGMQGLESGKTDGVGMDEFGGGERGGKHVHGHSSPNKEYEQTSGTNAAPGSASVSSSASRSPLGAVGLPDGVQRSNGRVTTTETEQGTELEEQGNRKTMASVVTAPEKESRDTTTTTTSTPAKLTADGDEDNRNDSALLPLRDGAAVTIPLPHDAHNGNRSPVHHHHHHPGSSSSSSSSTSAGTSTTSSSSLLIGAGAGGEYGGSNNSSSQRGDVSIGGGGGSSSSSSSLSLAKQGGHSGFSRHHQLQQQSQSQLQQQQQQQGAPRRNHCRDVSVFATGSVVGEGTYGVVTVATDLSSGKRVALKKIKYEQATMSHGFPVTSMREIKYLKSVQHPNIVRLQEVVTSKPSDTNRMLGDVFLVFEYMEGDANGLITYPDLPRTHSQVKCYMYQLLSGLAHLHSRGILHRDLKPGNLFISRDHTLKIGDFGLCKRWKPGLPMTTTQVVTAWYRAPELWLGDKLAGPPVDVWSCGIIFVEFMSGSPPFFGKQDLSLLQDIWALCGLPSEATWPGVTKLPIWPISNPKRKNYTPNIITKYREYFCLQGMNLLQRLLTLDPAKRITAAEALHHPYFTEGAGVPDPRSLPPIPVERFHEGSTKKAARPPPAMPDAVAAALAANPPSTSASAAASSTSTSTTSSSSSSSGVQSSGGVEGGAPSSLSSMTTAIQTSSSSTAGPVKRRRNSISMETEAAVALAESTAKRVASSISTSGTTSSHVVAVTATTSVAETSSTSSSVASGVSVASSTNITSTTTTTTATTTSTTASAAAAAVPAMIRKPTIPPAPAAALRGFVMPKAVGLASTRPAAAVIRPISLSSASTASSAAAKLAASTAAASGNKSPEPEDDSSSVFLA